MAMRNAVQPHLVKHPCSKCGEQTPALKKGVLQAHLVCPNCSGELERQWRGALAQRSGIEQAAKRMAREVLAQKGAVLKPIRKEA